MPIPNRVLFRASTPANGSELWITDGTAAGTSLLKDIFPGTSTSSAPSWFTQFGDKVLFTASDSTHVQSLWATDGTTAGTSLLNDVVPLPRSGIQGTAVGFALAGGNLVFSGTSAAFGSSLWVTNGTSAGTSLLKDIYPGNTPGNAPTELTAAGGKLVFQGSDPAHGTELWVTDGTAAGTSLVKDINLNAAYAGGPTSQSTPRYFTSLAASGLAIFTANDGTAAGNELWVTDGTTGGTSLLKDIEPASGKSSSPGPAVLVGTKGLAVFTATESTHGRELWVTDGTTAGTSLLLDIAPGAGSGLSQFNVTATPFGDKVLFFASDTGATGDRGLWITDGTTAGTSKLSGNGVYMAGLGTFTMFGSKALFLAANSGVVTPWITDGTAAGTLQLSSARASSLGFGVVGTHAVFGASSADGFYGSEPWVTDGTPAGTSMLKNINTSVSTGSSPTGFTTLGNGVLFSANDGSHGSELWIYHEAGGAVLLKDINTGFNSSNPDSFAAVSFAVACFAAGTRIRTVSGEIAVEHLREGDLTITASGEVSRICWIGSRRINVARHLRPESVSPVRIAPHAFGANLPHTALLLSPDHAVYAGTVLIPVKYLINGETIAQVATDEVVYYHIELTSHDVVLAEGLPVESYLNSGDRDNFEGETPTIRLYPDFAGVRQAARWEAHGYAPLRVAGPDVDRVRALLAEQAAKSTTGAHPTARAA